MPISRYQSVTYVLEMSGVSAICWFLCCRRVRFLTASCDNSKMCPHSHWQITYTWLCHALDTSRGNDVIARGPPTTSAIPGPSQMQSCGVFMFGWATCWTNSPIAGDLKIHWYHCYCWIRFLTVTNPHTERAASHVLQVATRWCFNSLLPSLYNTGIWVWINLKVICV